MLNNEENVVELTYFQLAQRLKLLNLKYPKFKLCANCSVLYQPVDLLHKAIFEFDNTDYLCYKTPLNCEKHPELICSSEAFNLNVLSEDFYNSLVLIVDNDNKTYSVCGVYVDEDNERIVLMNGYYCGISVNWVELKNNLY